jgi:hypothetical protein
MRWDCSISRPINPRGFVSRRFSHSKISIVHTMHGRGKVLVIELRSTVTGDDIAIGSVADRCLRTLRR